MGSGEFLLWEFPLSYWVEQQGYDVSYISNVDTHTDGPGLKRAKGFIPVGHDEYWTLEMYDNVSAARDAGAPVGLAVLLLQRAGPAALQASLGLGPGGEERVELGGPLRRGDLRLGLLRLRDGGREHLSRVLHLGQADRLLDLGERCLPEALELVVHVGVLLEPLQLREAHLEREQGPAGAAVHAHGPEQGQGQHREGTEQGPDGRRAAHRAGSISLRHSESGAAARAASLGQMLAVAARASNSSRMLRSNALSMGLTRLAAQRFEQ